MKLTNAKRKMKRRTSKTEKGITLLALAVTIIIMLILAGVTLNAALGDHGLIKEAQATVNDYEDAQEEESESLEKIRNQITQNRKKNNNNTENTNKITFKGNTNGIDVTLDAESLKDYYGEEVTSFSSVEGVKWQLFYDDADNYYLIASDYVPIDTLPSELIKESQAEGKTKYKAWFATWDSSSSSYKGPIVETGEWSKGTASNTITGNPLTSKYLRWVGSSVNTVADNPNMKAVAYMMDTNKWSNFAGSTSGAKAMGGPTLEMFIKSYNAKHDTKISTYEDENRNSTISSTNANSNGYKVKWENGTSWSDSISGLDTSEGNMWVKTSTDRAYAMWVASPSSDDNIGVMRVTYIGYLWDNDVSYNSRWAPSSSFNSKILNPIIVKKEEERKKQKLLKMM